MTIADRQAPAVVNGSGVTSLTFTFGENVASGSLITVQLFSVTVVTITFTGSGVGSWVLSADSGAIGYTFQQYYGFVSGSVGDTVTATFNTAASYAEMVVGEWTGVSALDTASVTSGTGTTATPPALSLASAGELVILSSIFQNAVTGYTDHGFTDVFNPIGTNSAYSWQILTGGTYTPETYTIPTGTWFGQASAFKTPAASAGIAGLPFVTGQSVKAASLY